MGVNNLACGQNLTFAPRGLTIVYGNNGTGKSGYARILKRVCRSRNPGDELLANVYASPAAQVALTATIEYRLGGIEAPSVAWTDTGMPHPVLSAVGVFDSSCAAIYIGSKNEIAARPFGLDIPDELADVCKRLDTRLSSQQTNLQNKRNPWFSQPPWKAGTAVGKAMATLKADTDLSAIRTLASLSDEEKERAKQLKENLARDASIAARQLRLKATRIQTLVDELSAVRSDLADSLLEAAHTSNQEAINSRNAATNVAEALFSSNPLPGVGGETWKRLWESAREYSTSRAYPAQPFPPVNEDAHCLLCQQSLADDARQRLQSFEAFVQADTEKKAQQAERLAKDQLMRIRALDLSSKRYFAGLQELATENPKLQKSASRYLASVRLRRYLFESSLKRTLNIVALQFCPTGELQSICDELEARAVEVDRLVDPMERARLQTELDELEDRQHLATSMQLVEAEHLRLVSVAVLEACRRDCGTTAITNLGNKLADSIVTPQLRDRFLDEIASLVSNKVRVEIVRVGGRYGSPHYQVRLLAKPDAKLLGVLSEGEQTCVALAAFLTEVATMNHVSALIFDDPVTSLDHRWRKSVAGRLVKEAGVRQIIVFTHDLVFVNDLHDLAGRLNTPHVSRTIVTSNTGTGIVEDGLPWQGKSIEDRLDKLGKRARDAKQLFDDGRDNEYADAVSAIYNRLRATWERGLESVAFAGVVQRHRDYIDTKPLHRSTVFSDADCQAFLLGFKRCCDVTDAHDPSAGRNASPPTPSQVLRDVQDCLDWTKSLRQRQSQIA